MDVGGTLAVALGGSFRDDSCLLLFVLPKGLLLKRRAFISKCVNMFHCIWIFVSLDEGKFVCIMDVGGNTKDVSGISTKTKLHSRA